MCSRLISRNLKIKIRKTVLALVLCGCETWSLILREEYVKLYLHSSTVFMGWCLDKHRHKLTFT